MWCPTMLYPYPTSLWESEKNYSLQTSPYQIHRSNDYTAPTYWLLPNAWQASQCIVTVAKVAVDSRHSREGPSEGSVDYSGGCSLNKKKWNEKKWTPLNVTIVCFVCIVGEVSQCVMSPSNCRIWGTGIVRTTASNVSQPPAFFCTSQDAPRRYRPVTWQSKNKSAPETQTELMFRHMNLQPTQADRWSCTWLRQEVLDHTGHAQWRHIVLAAVAVPLSFDQTVEWLQDARAQQLWVPAHMHKHTQTHSLDHHVFFIGTIFIFLRAIPSIIELLNYDHILWPILRVCVCVWHLWCDRTYAGVAVMYWAPRSAEWDEESGGRDVDILPPERQGDGQTDRQAELSLLLSLCLSLQTQLIRATDPFKALC